MTLANLESIPDAGSIPEGVLPAGGRCAILYNQQVGVRRVAGNTRAAGSRGLAAREVFANRNA